MLLHRVEDRVTDGSPMNRGYPGMGDLGGGGIDCSDYGDIPVSVKAGTRMNDGETR